MSQDNVKKLGLSRRGWGIAFLLCAAGAISIFLTFGVIGAWIILPAFICLAMFHPFSDQDVTVIGTVEASDMELKARNKRNLAIALALAGFMFFVFFAMLARAGAI